MDGDTICYSCGRVLASSRIMKERIGMQLDRHSGANTYKMTTAPKRRGYVQTDRGRSKNILKGGKNRFHPTQKSLLLFEELIKKHKN